MKVSRWINRKDGQNDRVGNVADRPDYLAAITGVVFHGLLAVTPCEASLIIRQGNTPTTITFDESLEGVNEGAFAGGGFSPDPVAGQLNSHAWSLGGMGGGLPFGGVVDSGTLARGTSTGGVTAVGIYAFDVGGNWILGIQPGGSDFTPGSITLRLQNQTGQLVTLWDLSYDIYYFNDQQRGNRLDFSHADNEGSFTSVPDLDFTTPADRDQPPQWERVARSFLVEQPVAPGEYLYLRWSGNDALGSGSRDEYGLDNIRVTALLAEPPPLNPSAVPEPCSLAQFAILFLLTTFVTLHRRPYSRTASPCRLLTHRVSQFGTRCLILRRGGGEWASQRDRHSW